MNVLIVYAHPEPTSFTGAMKDAAVALLAAHGHAVTVSDLYAERFNPVADRHDFHTVADAARFHYQSEQAHASQHAGFADDLLREQARVAGADALLFLFPLWWGGMPAILKGWFDRVLAYGFAYADGKRYDSGFFHGRKGMLGISTGGTAARFTRGGSYGDIDQVLHGVQHCMLEYLGLQTAAPFVAYAAPRVDAAARAQLLAQWQQSVLDLLAAPAGPAGTALEQAQQAARDGGQAWSLAR